MSSIDLFTGQNKKIPNTFRSDVIGTTPGSNCSNETLKKMVERIVKPIVFYRKACGACDIKTDSIQELKRYSSYGDVVMELKNKFAIHNEINSII